MGRYNHFSGSKINAVSGVGGDVFKELHNGFVGCLCGSRLLLPYITEGYKELVVDGSTVEQQRANNGLHTEDAISI